MNNIEKTVNSMRKRSDFPFYSAQYFGDYKIEQFIQGKIEHPENVIPFFEDLFEKLGCPKKINMPNRHELENPGCSAFYIKQNVNGFVGKNLDWKKTSILLLKTVPINRYSSISLVDLELCDLFKIGQLTNTLALSPYVPFDGINEKGLVITMLSVINGSQYPVDIKKTIVGDFNIIRIILDTCKNITEAIEVMKKYQIMQTGPLPIHYLIADNQSSCIVEFIDNALSVIEHEKIACLTNYLVNNDYQLEFNRKNCDRFKNLENTLCGKEYIFSKSNLCDLLESVSVYQDNYSPPSTIWSVLYDIEQKEMMIKIGTEKKYYVVKI
jgi:hypothetical protein